MKDKKKAAVKKGTVAGAGSLLREINNKVNLFNQLYSVDDRTRLVLTTVSDCAIDRLKTFELSLQFNQDLMMINLHRTFGFAESRQKRYYDNYNEIYPYFRKLAVDCAKDDPDMDMFWHELETALKDACGQYFEPKETRYHMNINLDGNLVDTMEYTDIVDFLAAPIKEKRIKENDK